MKVTNWNMASFTSVEILVLLGNFCLDLLIRSKRITDLGYSHAFTYTMGRENTWKEN